MQFLQDPLGPSVGVNNEVEGVATEIVDVGVVALFGTLTQLSVGVKNEVEGVATEIGDAGVAALFGTQLIMVELDSTETGIALVMQESGFGFSSGIIASASVARVHVVVFVSILLLFPAPNSERTSRLS